MTTDRLTELMEETAASVAPPSLAEASWIRAAAVRRRRRVAAVLTTVVAVVAVTVPFSIGGGGERHVIPVPPAESVAPGVDGMPRSLVPRAIAPLPQSWRIPADAPVLSRHPVSRAVMVAQEHDWEAEGNPMLPLHVLDVTGQWVRVDIGDLTRTHDVGGNEADPLRAASLSPDGRRVALPQPEAVVVIDLTTAKAHRIAVPGLNEQVMWWGDDVVLVEGGGAGLTRVNWATGATSREPASISAWRSTGSRVAAGPIPELLGDEGRLTLRTWELGTPGPLVEMPVDGVVPPEFRVTGWYGAGIPNGAGLTVSAAWGDSSSMMSGAEMVVVVDTATGSVRRLLDMGVIGRRVKMCCTPLYWIDQQTVLVQTDLEGLISWNVRTGEIHLVTAGPIPARLSVNLA